MSRLRKRGKPALNSQMNIVPYVDVMFVLLTIFMVTATTISVGSNVDAPKFATDAESNDIAKHYVIVEIDKEEQSSMILNNQTEGPYDLSTLTSMIESLVEQQPDMRVFVRGDVKTSYGAIIATMESLQEMLNNVGSQNKVQLMTSGN